MKFIAIVLFVLGVAILPTVTDPQTVSDWYVRNGGGTNVQCNGHTNVDYSLATAPNCAFANQQDAVNAATWGDTIKLHAGQVFDGTFNLIDKGTPPTGTDADYITITTDDVSGIPAALSNYPASDTRITTAMAANMPTVRTVSSLGYPAYWINKTAKYWKLDGLNITNNTTVQVIRLIGMGEAAPTGPTEYPDHFTVRRSWIHPKEETGTPMDAGNAHRTAENCIYLEGTNLLVEFVACQGFAGLGPSNERLTTSDFLATSVVDHLIIRNSLLEAWTYATFFGGGGSWATSTATVSNCTANSCVFSNTTGITVGTPVAIVVYDTGGHHIWGNAFVTSISGSTVNYTTALCAGFNDPNFNSCMPFTSANPQQIPSNGALAQWAGYQPQNILEQSNIYAHRPDWQTFLTDCGGKGYFEIKNCKNCTKNGNIFKGCTGSTITVRNQDGSIPWANLDNLTLSNNYWQDGNGIFTAFLKDGNYLTRSSANVTFTNNLAVGPKTIPGLEYFKIISQNFYGGAGMTITHNTVLVSSYRDFISFATTPFTGLVMRDNIFRAAPNPCTDASGNVSFPITACWGSAIVNHNVLLSIDGWTQDDLNGSWFNFFPNNTLVTSVAGVGFTTPSVGLDVSGNYQLLSTSPYHNTASDGTDYGVNFSLMNAAIYGNAPPVSNATPTPSPSPSPSPTPTPTPSPSPAPQVPTSVVITDNAGNVLPLNGASIKVGASQQFKARVLDQFGVEMPLSVTSWGSSSPSYASVSSTGLVRAKKTGAVRIWANYNTTTVRTYINLTITF
jgi:hypothetical protein